MTVLPSDLMFPLRTVTERGGSATILADCRHFGSRGVLVYGASLKQSGALDRLLGDAPDRSVLPWQHEGGEPTLEQLERLLSAARGHEAAWVAAIGGGSVMDLAKACAGLLEAPLPAAAYHDGAPIEPSCIPFIAAPTTAGTGSEATCVSVLTNTARGVKKSIRHASFMPRHVLLDADLLAPCPPQIFASAGFDALTQAIEAYTSRHATAVTDGLAIEGFKLITGALPAAYAGDDGDCLEQLLQGSYLAGLALSNARLGVVHGLAHPLGVRYHQPHGLVCGICLPIALEFNREAIATKYQTLCDTLGGDLMGWIETMMRRFRLSSPFAGQPIIDEAGIIAEALASGSTKANPREVSEADLRALLAKLFGSSRV